MPPPKKPTLTVLEATPLAIRPPSASTPSSLSGTSKSTAPFVWSNGFSSLTRCTHGLVSGDSGRFLRDMRLLLEGFGHSMDLGRGPVDRGPRVPEAVRDARCPHPL